MTTWMIIVIRLFVVACLVDEVKALVPIRDDNLQEGFVRLYIENDPQVHLELCSVPATRADSFSPGFECAHVVD